ncbi:hypothetical protein FDB55_16915 [Clostridium botulinum]|uniref:Iron-only hydrogenase system regulator n=1 Tax=Clostridium botulinum TaxID=1491 RepID=A0A0C2NRL9_CLOBO|nr:MULTISPECIES: hypothetical protein [Clostridium]ACD51276.1 conserved hypothetical protein [Clostridium botulinum E3 str. Alaska E43]AJF29859.1 hypothetical protein ST13_09205 [Clostridium botulinum]AJF32920.1 hypothetical protein ST12_09205 [Clostridium botulinum]KAI3349480.1 hypothetical protein CIT18_07730 [Clostridium botulinum]KIL07324.1 hypothetical protein SR42_14145 [Clostridium botulinum]
METIIMAVTIDPRSAHAPEVQTILTKHGCIIKTRVGLHEVSKNSCSEQGLIILHIHSSLEEIKVLENDLLKIDGVKVKHMTL